MRRTPVRLAAALLAAGAAAASGAAAHGMFDTGLHAMLRDCHERIRPRSEAFGAGLLGAASEAGTRNALVSPLGIGFVLEMVVPGAKRPVRRSIRELIETGDGSPDTGGSAAGGSHGDGPGGYEESIWVTHCRHVWVLHDASQDEAVAVQAANAAFADRRLALHPAYAETLQAVFGARAERLDFSDERSVDHINAWVAEATNGAIPELVSRLGSDDRLVLANAMYFEGEWAQRFDPERTVSAPFHLRTGAAPEVPTMHADDLPARYREDGDLQAVALPYGDGDFELVAVLPRAGVEAPEALRRLAADPSWLGGRGFHEARGTLALPRLDLDVETSLLPALRALGLGAALDDRQAFAGIAAPAPELSRVLHRATLVLDERGTVAAAATAAVMEVETIVSYFEMRVDRPFALAVRHRGTGAVLFTAWVDDPVQS